MDISLRWDKTRSGHLCRSCKFSHVRKSGEQEMIICQQTSRPHDLVKRPVESCSDYYPRDSTSLAAMQQIAWTVSTDRDKKHIGFKPPKREKGENPEYLSDRRD